MRRSIALSLLALFVSTGPSSAMMFCSEPSSEPWCLSDDGTFRGSDAFENCRWEVERFVSEVNEYVDCLRQEQEEQIDRANEAVERFNCGAESGEVCW